MCTKAIAVNARGMSDKLKATLVIANHQGLSEAALSEKLNRKDILPTDLTPVITHNRPRDIQYMRWGLIPAYAVAANEFAPMFNARAETLAQLPSFRDLIMASRCLILNEGFYERQTQGDERVEYKITPANEDYFYKAGLWTTWRNPNNGEITESFTMITCDPKEREFSKYHDRIPIIMNKAERRAWMNPQATKDELLALLRPCSEEMYTVTEDSRKPLKATKGKSKGKGEDRFF
jgi:putative SOS response-associated peptidase YedK